MLQCKRIVNKIEGKGIDTILLDKDYKEDRITGILFKYRGVWHKIGYSYDKIKGYEYSIVEGDSLDAMTVMGSNISYKHVKTYLDYL